MPELRVVIVDDEPMARSALRRIMAEFDEVRVCGEADSVESAARIIRETRADAVYLDIELYSESGFDLVETLDETTAVVFVTAYPQYALKAFEADARDYLLKPVTRDRMAETIRRLKRRQAPAPQNPKQILLDEKILVRGQKQRFWIPIHLLSRIEAKGDFTRLTAVDGRKGIVWQSLRHWETHLPQEQFVRIHRRMIVNLDHVQSFETTAGNCIRLNIRGAVQPCVASRRRSPGLRKRLLDRI